MTLESLLGRVDQLIGLVKTALASEFGYEGSNQTFLKDEPVAELRAAGLSFLRKTFGADHPYYTEFDKLTEAAWPHTVQGAHGLLKAVRGEIDGGWMTSTRGLVSAEIFSDFIEMADHLLSEGYKDAAAVILGGVLEEHMRQLATAAGIPTAIEKNGKAVPVKADTLNAELVKAKRYNVLQQKEITSWLGLRNHAAHGQYSEYSPTQVQGFLGGLKGFILSTTA